MTGRGWNAAELARRMKVATSTVTRFLNGSHQSPRTLKLIAGKLGRKPEEYLRSAEAEVQAIS